MLSLQNCILDGDKDGDMKVDKNEFMKHMLGH